MLGPTPDSSTRTAFIEVEKSSTEVAEEPILQSDVNVFRLEDCDVGAVMKYARGISNQ